MKTHIHTHTGIHFVSAMLGIEPRAFYVLGKQFHYRANPPSFVDSHLDIFLTEVQGNLSLLVLDYPLGHVFLSESRFPSLNPHA